MLDWLKTILQDTYTDDIDKKISEEIGRNFVAPADFNNLNTEKKSLADTVSDRDKQLETLRASNGDIAALKEQISVLQEENKKAAQLHESEIKSLKVDAAVERALSEAKAKNIKAAKALLELNTAELAEDGTIKGLDEQIRKLAQAPESSFLFDTNQKKQGFKGLTPGESGEAKGGKALKEMSYDELCSYLAENPNTQL